MSKNTRKGKTLGSQELSSLGGKQCLKKHGREFYQRIAEMRWKKNPSAAGAAKSRKAVSKPKASAKTANA